MRRESLYLPAILLLSILVAVLGAYTLSPAGSITKTVTTTFVETEGAVCLPLGDFYFIGQSGGWQRTIYGFVYVTYQGNYTVGVLTYANGPTSTYLYMTSLNFTQPKLLPLGGTMNFTYYYVYGNSNSTKSGISYYDIMFYLVNSNSTSTDNVTCTHA
jgi:hypothetical protein